MRGFRGGGVLGQGHLKILAGEMQRRSAEPIRRMILQRGERFRL